MSQGGHWLNRERLTAYPRIFLTLYLLVAVAWVCLSKNGVDLKGTPLGADFITYWAASHLGLSGRPEAAYDVLALSQAERLAVPASHSVFAWYYPPPFYLLVLPLALLPYLLAYFAFMLTTLACYVLALRRIIAGRIAWWCLAASAGVWVNLSQGQNGFLTAAVAGTALLSLERRPVLAGVLIGMLAIKPHLALLFPVALLAVGAWRTFWVAGAVAAALMGLGTAVLGVATLEACLASLDLARRLLEAGALPWYKMPTVFAFLRMLGVPSALAYAGHAMLAVAATAAVWIVWRRSQSWALRNAALMTATLMISPYLFDYDLAWLAFPIAWLTVAGLRDGWLRGEREVLVAAWLLPVLVAPLAKLAAIPVGPLVLAALLWTVVRRAGVSGVSGVSGLWQPGFAAARQDAQTRQGS